MEMNTSTPRSIVCPVLIGRTSYLEALVQLIEQACSNQGQTVLIAGEAGVGKSRLVAEALIRLRLSQTQAVSHTPLVLEGRCFEPDRSLPYAPLLDLMRAFLATRSSDDIATLLGPTSPELIKLLPELTSVLPQPMLNTNPYLEQEKRRLFQALMDFFLRLSATQPVILIIEDVHWGDDMSLEFLLFLARRIAGHPLLLLLTYRSEEEHPALLQFLAGLDRERHTTELRLSHLTIDEVEVMISTIFGWPRTMGASFLTMIYTLTEGNPFFIEEILKSLVDRKSTRLNSSHRL